MFRVIFKIILVASVASSTMLRAKDFHKSCVRLSIEGNVLKAICKDVRGRNWPTELLLREIENIFGRLENRNSNKGANFHETCRDTQIDTFSGKLITYCDDGNGRLLKASYPLQEVISNTNGQLTYDQ